MQTNETGLLAAWGSQSLQPQTEQEILTKNAHTAAYGLVLTAAQAAALAQTQTESLLKSGRIAFGGGTVGKLIDAFCDSPYMTQAHYEDSLHTLIGLFYDSKTATHDRVSDDALIQYMKTAFNGDCHGSFALLEQQLEQLARKCMMLGAHECERR